MNACTALIVAAGRASRMQGIDKIMAPLGGIPLILRTVKALAACPDITKILLVTREDLISPIYELCRNEPKFTKAIVGGESRAESVLLGLQAVDTPWVAIHDGARPLVTKEIVSKAIAAAHLEGAAAPAIPVKDTIKVAEKGLVQRTPDRSQLFAVQTPQVFSTESILQALRQGIAEQLPLTDDCSAMEATGHPVFLTEGSEENLKITTPMDLLLAEAILARRSAL